jgi:hypothetical protein
LSIRLDQEVADLLCLRGLHSAIDAIDGLMDADCPAIEVHGVPFERLEFGDEALDLALGDRRDDLVAQPLAVFADVRPVRTPLPGRQ